MKAARIFNPLHVLAAGAVTEADIEFINQIVDGDDDRGIGLGPRPDMLGHIEPDAITIVYAMLNEKPTGIGISCPTLTPEERLSFILRYANEERYTLEQIAEMVSRELHRNKMTKERIRQVIISAMRKIKTRVELRIPGTFPEYQVNEEELMMAG